MSVRVIDNTPRLNLEMNQKVSLFIRFMLDEVHKHAKPITPYSGGGTGGTGFKGGHLREDVIKKSQASNGQIVWPKVYAAVQEKGSIKGRPIRNYTTPGTGKSYAERAVRKAVERSQDTMRKARLI